MKTKLLIAIATTSVAVSSTATAQTAPQSRILDVVYTGVVTDDGVNSIRIRQPDGTSTPYVGPVPDYPYKVGDTVKIAFKANVPTQAYYDYVGQTSVDGLYRFTLGTASSGGTPFLASTSPTASGALMTISSLGEPPFISGVTMVYNSNTDSYALDFSNRNWFAGTLDGPGLYYDPTTKTLSPSASTCLGGNPAGCSAFALGGIIMNGNYDTASANVGIYSNEGVNSGKYGAFTLGFSGSWNLANFNSPTSVPAPGMAIAFGFGALALMRRRRRKQT